MAYSTSKSRTLLSQGAAVMPRGVPYGYGAGERFHSPATAYPLFAKGSAGAHVTDADGNDFIDFYGSHGTRILGYSHPAVLKAMRGALDDGAATSFAHASMVQAAEALVEHVAIADWATVHPSGAHALRTAVSIARASTERSTIIVVRDAHYGHPWFSHRPGVPGVIDDDFTAIVPARWGRLEDIDAALSAHSGKVAAIIVPGAMSAGSANTHEALCSYWEGIRSACDRTDVPLIVDETSTGFRLHAQGSDQYYGVNADVVCFDSVIANGEPLGALCGRENLRWWASAVPHGHAAGVSALSCVAAVATLKELAKKPSASALSDVARPIVNGIAEAAAGHGIDVAITGEPSLWTMRVTTDDNGVTHQAWLAECARRGVYFNPAGPQFPCFALTAGDRKATLAAVDEACAAVTVALPEYFR